MKEQPVTAFFGNDLNEPAILLGNGPSLKLLEPYREILFKRRFIQIGMNKSWKLWPTRYHCIMFHYEHLQDLANEKWDPTGTILWTYKPHSEEYVRKITLGDVVFVNYTIWGQDDPDMQIQQMSGMISSFLDEGSSADMTGHFALEVALWLGCNPIYLIGYDLYGGHFCDNVAPEKEWQNVQVDLFDQTAEQFQLEWPEIKVYNLSPDSLITGFEKRDIEDILGGAL